MNDNNDNNDSRCHESCWTCAHCIMGTETVDDEGMLFECKCLLHSEEKSLVQTRIGMVCLKNLDTSCVCDDYCPVEYTRRRISWVPNMATCQVCGEEKPMKAYQYPEYFICSVCQAVWGRVRKELTKRLNEEALEEARRVVRESRR